MMRQLNTLPNTDTVSQPMPVRGQAEGTATVMANTSATLRNEAGARRRMRLDQKFGSAIVSVRSRSRISSEVMRKPDRVKKVETPRNPPGWEPMAV